MPTGFHTDKPGNCLSAVGDLRGRNEQARYYPNLTFYGYYAA